MELCIFSLRLKKKVFRFFCSSYCTKCASFTVTFHISDCIVCRTSLRFLDVVCSQKNSWILDDIIGHRQNNIDDECFVIRYYCYWTQASELKTQFIDISFSMEYSEIDFFCQCHCDSLFVLNSIIYLCSVFCSSLLLKYLTVLFMCSAVVKQKQSLDRGGNKNHNNNNKNGVDERIYVLIFALCATNRRRNCIHEQNSIFEYWFYVYAFFIISSCLTLATVWSHTGERTVPAHRLRSQCAQNHFKTTEINWHSS